MTFLILLVAQGFLAADRAPLNDEWTSFMRFGPSQRAWTSALVSMGKCMDKAMCLGPGERIYELDTPLGFVVGGVTICSDKGPKPARLLAELPIEMTGDPRARTHLFVTDAGDPDSLIVASTGGVTVVLRRAP